MDSTVNTASNVFELESFRNKIIEKIFNATSNNSKIFLLYTYFSKVHSTQNNSLIEAFLKEFLEDYISAIQKLEVSGINPEFTGKLLEQIKQVSTLKFVEDILTKLRFEIDRIEHQINKLNLILEGKEYEDGIEHKAFFPLIDKNAPAGFYGIIESVTIRINKTTDNDKFIMVPSEKEIEKKISEQCKKSWLLAVDILKKYVKKPYQYHEVVISFVKKEGFYEGNSLGIALTLSFLEELLKFYNPTYAIKIKERSAFTGGIDSSGEVQNIGEEIIKQKVAAIFFSEINSFVIPKLEETYAYFALTQLKNQFPQRNLKLIPVEDINDVLNRRDLAEIKKINPVVRTGKLIKKNWVGALVAVWFTIILSFLFVLDFDDNPYLIDAENGVINIRNKPGRILWNKKTSLGAEAINDNFDLQKYFVKIVNIDDDRENEVPYYKWFCK